MYTISIRNMTQVNSTEIIVYSDEAVDTQYKVESANLKMEEGSAGSLTMKVPVGNAGYDYFEELSTQVIVRKDTVTSNPDKVYWMGRLLSMNIDFNNSKELVFEGIFNYLMDTIQLPSKSECPLSNWVTFLLERHNAICTGSGEHYKKVYKGTWDNSIDTVSHEFYTDYETSQEMINNAIEYDELHTRFRYVWDSTNSCYNLYIDFKKDYDASGNVPVISFGQNLMDYSRSYEVDEMATVLIPRGERYSDEDWDAAISGQNPKEDSTAPSELDHYHTIWSCATATDHTLHDYRVYTTDTANLNKFGYVCKTMDFDGVRDYDTLLALARNYLANQKWIKLTIEISALDMKLLSPSIDLDEISVGRMIHCISAPHGLNYYYPCTGIDEDILDVSGSKYTLGTGDVQYLTDAKRDTDEKLKEVVRKNIERENILTTNILHKPLNDFTYIKQAIDDVEILSEEGIATVKTEAKTYALNLLNIFDEETNPNKKGYVHFLKETADYEIDENVLTFEKIKTRITKYFTGTNLTYFFNKLETAFNNANSWTPGDTKYVIYALFGENDYETAIVIGSHSTISSTPIWKGYFNGSNYVVGNTFSNYVASGYAYFTSTSHTKYAYENNMSNRLNSSYSAYNFSWETANNYTNTSGYVQSYQHQYVVLCPSKPNFNLNSGNTKFYCSEDIYTDSNCTTLAFNKNMIKEAKKAAVSLYDIKQKFIAAAGGQETDINTFFNNVKGYLDSVSSHYVAAYAVNNSNDHQLSLTIYEVPTEYCDSNGNMMAYTAGSDNYIFGIYSRNPSQAMYVYWKEIMEGYVYSGTFVSQSPNRTIDAYSNRLQVSPNFSIATSYYCAYLNTSTMASTAISVYISEPAASADSGDLLYKQTLFNSNEPYTNERDHIYEIVISNTKDYMNTDSSNWCWRWNQYGLYALQGGYSESILPDGTYQDVNDRLRLALTYDGNIVADRITAGILNADVIKTGVIRSRPLGTAEPDGNMMIDIPNGNIIAKKGTLIFNNYRAVSTTASGIVAVPENEFIYISNIDCVNDQNVPIIMAVGGQSKNDWRIVSGDSFGVDKAGRVYMREGIIGATGGYFSVMASNTSYVNTYWNSSASAYTWDVTFNTDASRPLFTGTANEAMVFRFRLAHYDANDEYEYVTKLFSFEFDTGTSPKQYTAGAFYPVIEPDQEHTVPFANGELFPIWYQLNDSATEDYYEQDGHRYTPYPASGNNVVATSTSPNKYTTYTSVRSGSAGSNAGAVTIGSGYLSNGTFGQNQSFYLGGLKRSGTVAENTRTDWRFSVGSKFGVTENGNIYCTDMYARGAYLDRCTVNGRITVSSLTNLNLNSSNPVPSSSESTRILWRINTDATSRGDGMFGQHTDFYMMVDTSNSQLLTPSKSPKFKFIFSIQQYQTQGGEEWDKQAGTFDFTYDRSGTPGIAQNILIDTRTWGNPDSGYTAKTSSAGDVIFTVNVEMVTSETDSFKFVGSTQLKTYPTQVVQGAEGWTYVEGYVEVLKVTSDPRPAVACGADFIGKGKWLGGPQMPWGCVYASDFQTVSSSSGSSLLYKNDIAPISNIYSEIFDRLKPVKYKFNKKTFDDGGKFHTGFIMEDVGEILKELGIPENELAAYNPDHEHGGGGLRYDEFIAITVNEVQKLKRRINDLEEQLYEQGLIDDTDD